MLRASSEIKGAIFGRELKSNANLKITDKVYAAHFNSFDHEFSFHGFIAATDGPGIIKSQLMKLRQFAHVDC